MVTIWLALLTLGSAISMMSFFVNLKLTISAALRNPFFYSQILSLLGLCGLTFYGIDFINLHHQISLVLPENLPALLDSISKILWPVLGFTLLVWFASQIIYILKNPGIYEGLAQVIFGKNQQNASKTDMPIVTISSDSNYTDYQKDEFNKLLTDFNNLPNEPNSDKLHKLLEFAVNKKVLGEFEYIFGQIYGSQISALRALANNFTLDIHSFYDEYLAKQKLLLPKSKPSTYEEWVKFLLNTSLISEEGNLFKLLPKGKDFLGFISGRYEKAL